MKYKLIEHPADIKIKVWGQTLKELFRNAALGMTKILKEKVPDGKATRRQIKVEASDQSLLLADFLSQLNTLASIHREVYPKIEFKELTRTKLWAYAFGVTVDRFDEEIKAVTYHELKVEKKGGKWQAVILFDI